MTCYTGGKCGIGKAIAEQLNLIDPSAQWYWEPFVGMCGVMRHIRRPVRVGTDIHSELIAMWQSLQQGWIPPRQISEQQYMEIKQNPKAPPALRAFVGHGYAFGGAYFDAFKPKYGDGIECGRRAFNGVMTTLALVRDVHFFAQPYQKGLPRSLRIPKGQRALIYCDPPYAHSGQQVKNLSFVFDHEQFWEWVRQQSKHHTVVVSETQAPADFVAVWVKPRGTTLSASSRTAQSVIVEQLFMHPVCLKRLGYM